MNTPHRSLAGFAFVFALFITVAPFGIAVAYASSINISTCTQLQNIGATSTEPVSGSYVLTQNVDCSATATWNPNGLGGYYGFSPIPDFTGTLNGAGYSITNLYISTTTSNVGLFSKLDATSTVQNLTLSGGSISGGSYVGALAGQMIATSTVQSVMSSVPVTGTQGYLGGLVGYMNSASTTIASSSASGAVSMTVNNYSFEGGLVGNVNGGTITGSFASGAVTSTGNSNSYIGGLVGYTSSNSPVLNSYATGNVIASGSSAQDVGGLIGDSQTAVTNTYETGSVTANGASDQGIGGLIGFNQASTIASSSASGAVSATGASGEYIGGFVGASSGAISNSFETGNITATTSSQYVGGFDGDQTAGSTITQCYETGNVTGGYYPVGGFVGASYATISKSFETGNVTLGAYSYAEYAGGFAGFTSTPIDDDYSTGNVTIPAGFIPNEVYYVGGFVGYTGGSVTNSYSTGNVIGNGVYDDVGGFIGYNTYPIINSYSTGGGTGLMGTSTSNVGYFLGETSVGVGSLTNDAVFTQGTPTIGDDHSFGSDALLATHGYGTDESTLANFYSITEPVYAQATSTPWNFTSIWETHPNTFPTFIWYSGVAPTYTITATAGTGGLINNAGALTVQSGANQSYNIIPNSGYTIANVLVDGTSVGAVSTYTFTNITASHTIAVTFTQTAASTPSPSGSGGGDMPWCSGPSAPGWNASLPGGGCGAAAPTPVVASVPATTTLSITPSCTAQLFPTKEIKYGAKNDPAQVMLLQKYLDTFEQAQLPVDGVYSKADEEAVIAWQEKYAADILTPWHIAKGTGYIYTTSLEKFKSLFLAQCQPSVSTVVPQSTGILKAGMSGAAVIALQQALIAKMTGSAARALGKGGATGYFGALTTAAVIEFQKSAGIAPALGYVGPATRAALGI